MTESPLFWHIHHEILLEPATEPIQNRIDYIRAYKPAKEVPIRLRLLRPAYNLPDQVVQAGTALDQAYMALNQAGTALDQAYMALKALDQSRKAFGQARTALDQTRWAYDQTLVDNKAEIDRLHKEQCEPDCPWNGQTIFPKKRS